MSVTMQRVEQVEILSASSEEKLATVYNQWYLGLHAARENIPTLQGQRIKIFDRRFIDKGSGKARKLSIAVFYEHMEVPEAAAGGDRGKHLDNTGVSAVGRRTR